MTVVALTPPFLPEFIPTIVGVSGWEATSQTRFLGKADVAQRLGPTCRDAALERYTR